MGSIRKRGKKYQARIAITKDFNQINETKTFDTKLEALMWIEIREKELHKGHKQQFDDSKSLADALIRYRNEVSPRKKGARWEIIRINAFLNDKNLPIKSKITSITTPILSQWRDSRQVSDASKNREVALLRSIFEIARREWKWIDHNPFIDLRRLREPPPRNRRVSEAEINLIIDELGFNEEEPTTQKALTAVIFLIALETAMRVGEIVGLDWHQVNLKAQFCTLLDTKNGDKRDVPLSRRAVKLFELMGEQQKGKVFAISSDSVGTFFRRAVNRCGIDDLTFHDSRHEACTRLAPKLLLLDLAKVIGHRDPRSLMIYYNPTASELAAKLD